MNECVYNEQLENMDERSLEYMNQFLTKQMLGLMLILAGGALSNKALAENLGKKPSAVSNLLERMKKSEIPLLNISRQNKCMMYSLSPIALKYIEQYAEPAKMEDGKVINLHSEIQECMLILNRLRESIGNDFEIAFDEMLMSYIGGKTCSEDFQIFMDCLERLIIKDYIKEYINIIRKFEAHSLQKKLQNYFAKYIYIRRLCSINAHDWKMAYEFIDSFFDLKCQSIGIDILKKCEDKIDMNEIIGIMDSLTDMNERGKDMSKKNFVDSWSKFFFGQEQLLYYIAEKIGHINY